jgi:hypothetical protein
VSIYDPELRGEERDFSIVHKIITAMLAARRTHAPPSCGAWAITEREGGSALYIVRLCACVSAVYIFMNT